MPYKEHGGWRATPWYKGRLPTKLCRSKGEAREYERETVKKARKEATLPKGMDLLSFCNRYLSYAERFNPNTYREKKTLCKRILNEWGPDRDADSVSLNDAQVYLDSQAQKRTPNASNRDRKNLIAQWSYGKEYLNLQGNPFKQTKKWVHNRNLPKVYLEEEVLLILLAATREEKLILQTFIETAGRRNEIFQLTWDDINIENQSIQMWTKKTRDGSMESEWLPISPVLASEYQWWLSNRPLSRSHFAFPNIRTGKPYVDPRKWIKRICERAGVECKGFHAFRRYVGSILADKYKMSTKFIQQLYRHKRLTTTEIYIHNVHSSLRENVGLAVPEGRDENTTRKIRK